MTVHYYNEFDPKAAAWLRELIKAGLIPKGEVDERSICEVKATDLHGFVSVHLFAGIGGWAYALRLAGWPDSRPVWTGSCPCQPYSAAGKQKAQADPRHLWPEMFRLIRECKPECVFGEQVEAAIRHGWLDGVCSDLEGEGYAVGSAVLGAHSVGAPHIRQRLYWVADSCRTGTRWDTRSQSSKENKSSRERPPNGNDTGYSTIVGCSIGSMAFPDGRNTSNGELQRGGEHGQRAEDSRSCGGVGFANGCRCGQGDSGQQSGNHATNALGDSSGAGLQERECNRRIQREEMESSEGQAVVGRGDVGGFWSAFDLIPCRDGKARRVEPGTFPLAHGVPGRVGLLRGYGNAIVPQVAAEFIKAYCDSG